MAIPFVGALTGIGNQIANWFKRQPTSISKLQGVGNTEVYAEIDSTTAITKGFNSNTAVYAIVNKASKKFGYLPRYVRSAGKAEQKALKEFEGLINRPNEHEGQDAFFAKLYAFKMVCGEAFIWLNRGIMADGLDEKARLKMPVLEMYVLPSNKMIVVPDETLYGVTGYLLEANERVAIAKEDVIHWKAPNLEFDAFSKPQLRGMSPLKAGYKTLEQNNSATDAAVRMYQNDGAKGLLSEKSLKAITPTQQAQIESLVDRKINNVDVKGAVATLQGDWTYSALGASSVDQELLEGKKISMQELCFLFELPYELFDPGTTYANKEQAQLGWVINVILPDCKQLDGEMNRVLPVSFGVPGDFIETDYTELPEVQKSMMETAKIMQEIWAITPDDIRVFLKYDKLGGEFAEPWTPANRTPLSKANPDDGGDEILNSIANGRAADPRGGDA